MLLNIFVSIDLPPLLASNFTVVLMGVVYGFASFMLNPLQKISGVFSLAKQNSIVLLFDLKPKEEIQLAYHAHFKFTLYHLRELSTQMLISNTKNNIIHIYLHN